MRGDLQRVSDRVVDAARVPYPQISTILEEIVRSGGKRLRPMLVLLAARAVLGPSVWISMFIFGILLAPAFYRV